MVNDVGFRVGRTLIGTEAVVRARADGYTLLHVTAAAINATMYDKLSFNFIRDIAPVASLVNVANVMTVHPAFPAKTVPEFIAYAKANPGHDQHRRQSGRRRPLVERTVQYDGRGQHPVRPLPRRSARADGLPSASSAAVEGVAVA